MSYKILYFYLFCCFIWAIFAVHKVRQCGFLGKLLINQIKVFILNFLAMPFCVYYAIKNKKL